MTLIAPPPGEKLMGGFSIIGILYIAAAVIVALSLSFCLFVEIKTDGLHATATNKFVVVSTVGNFSLLLNLIGLAIFAYNQIPAYDDFANFAFSCTIMCHLVLVLLRSAAVFQMAHPNLLKLINALITASIVFSILADVFGGVYFSVQSTFFFVMWIISSGLSFVLCGIVDVFCTLRFVDYVREVNVSQSQASFKAKEVQMRTRSTELIARRSAMICLLNLLSGVFMFLFWGCANAGQDQLSGLMSVIQQYLVLATMMMWMWLKVELDRLNRAPPPPLMLGSSLITSTTD
eukprot:TRINITY_DN2896_c0_g1_i1.p1 TRINITY_DN2896_c0_g1~~TRINITY_DN2896_c0_g1_i1.p1  ORF type:complete len:290 (+),score=46.56 TRINITY_DN2896_c0_g1_i1:1-870(+)